MLMVLNVTADEYSFFFIILSMCHCRILILITFVYIGVVEYIVQWTDNVM